MEVDSGLVSDLVHNKSIQKVLAPISAQVSHLIIVNEAYNKGDREAFPSGLLSNVQAVKKATDGLVRAARHVSQDSWDEELSFRMPSACDLLCVAGENLVTATHRVHLEDFSADSRQHLVQCAKDILQATLKVLLVSDEAEVRKILKANRWVQDRLGVLTAVKSMKHLVPAFKGFTEAFMVLSSLIDRRQVEMTIARQRESLIVAMATLKKCVPMLNSAMQTFVKYPDNDQAKTSREYVMGQILACLDDVTAVMDNRRRLAEDEDESENPGYFISLVDKMMDALSEYKIMELVRGNGDFDAILEAAVRHSMSVAHLSTDNNRDLIVKNCQRLLRQRTGLAELSKILRDDPCTAQAKADMEEACDRLCEEFQDLERHLNNTILQLLVDTISETTEPLERLVKTALSPQTAGSVGECVTMETEAEEFHSHADRMCQIARFKAASSVNAKRVAIISGCVTQLENLDPEILPAILACQKDPSNKAAIEHLRLLKQEWNNNVSLMVSAIDDITELKPFIELSEKEIRSDALLCKKSFQMEAKELKLVSRAVIGRARRASHVTKKFVDSLDDPIFRNGIMVYVCQLNKVIPAVKSAAKRLEEDLRDGASHASLHKRCDLTARCVVKIREAIEGRNHPSILDPARQSVRPPEGLKALDLDAADDYCSDEDTQTEQNVSLSNIIKVDENTRKDKALKSYVADLTCDVLADLMRNLTSAAIGGNQQKVDLLTNDVLARCNHVTDVASGMAKYINQIDQQQVLEESVSELVQLTPQLLDKARRVVDCDTYQVEPLHTVAELWAKRVSFLESYVDNILLKWKEVADKVIKAAKMANTRLLAAEIRVLDDHSKHVMRLCAEAADLLDNSDVSGSEHSHLFKEFSAETENLSLMMGTSADLLSREETEAERWQLECGARDWAARVLGILNLIERLSGQAVDREIGQVEEHLLDTTTDGQQTVQMITQHTLRTKQRVDKALEGSSDEQSLNELQKLLDALDQLNGLLVNMSISKNPTLTGSIEDYYATHTLFLLQWRWACKVKEINKAVNQLGTVYEDSVSSDRAVGNHSLTPPGEEDSVSSDRAVGNHSLMPPEGNEHSLLNTLRPETDSAPSVVPEYNSTPDNVIKQQKPSLFSDPSRSIQKSLQRETPTQLSGSLLDFADRLVVTSDGTGRSYTWNSQASSSLSHSDRALEDDGQLTPLTTDPGNADKPVNGLLSRTPVRLMSTPAFQSLSNSPAVSPCITGVWLNMEAEKWEDTQNPIVQVAKDISRQLKDMISFNRGEGPMDSKLELIEAAKSIADNGKKLVTFAQVISEYCIDKRFAKDVTSQADQIPTVIAQLNVMAGVKAATPSDTTAEKMLIRTSQNLVGAINKMLRASEAACVKGFREVPADALDEADAVVLATQWKKKLTRYRRLEASDASTDDLGLRRVYQVPAAPALSQIMLNR